MRERKENEAFSDAIAWPFRPTVEDLLPRKGWRERAGRLPSACGGLGDSLPLTTEAVAAGQRHRNDGELQRTIENVMAVSGAFPCGARPRTLSTDNWKRTTDHS